MAILDAAKPSFLLAFPRVCDPRRPIVNGRQSKFLGSDKIVPRCRPAATVYCSLSRNMKRTICGELCPRWCVMGSRFKSSETPRGRLFQSHARMSRQVGASVSAPVELQMSASVVVRSVSSVAFELRRVALAFASSPKNALSGVFSRSRRAAHTEAVSSIRKRLAHTLKVASVVSKSPVASKSALPRQARAYPGRAECRVLSASAVPPGALRH